MSPGCTATRRRCFAPTLARLIALGADITADILPFVGREVTAEMGDLVLERLRGYIPRRRWQEALAADPGDPQRSETRLH